MEFEHILCPVDFSEGSKKALNIALDFKKQFDAHIDVIHIVNNPFGDYVHPFEVRNMESCKKGAIEIARKELSKLKEEMPLPKDTKMHVLYGVPADEIINFAKARNVNLIIIDTHGRRGIARLVIGSVTEEVIRRATCPVLAVRL